MSRSLLALASSLLLCAAPLAQNAATPEFALELNALQPSEAGCRLTFLATNRLGGTLDRAAVEVALFSTSGAIDRIVTLDFKNLSEGKTKVLQFELAGLDCEDVGRMLVNDIGACEGEGLAPESCLAGLMPTAGPDITFGV
jgi:hypothetical protein